MKKNLSYIDSVHRDGCIWNLSCMVLMLLFPAAVCLIFGVSLDWHGFWMGLLATAPMFWAVGADIKSEEGEIVSTIAIAVSSIVTTLIIILGVALIIPLDPILNSPVLAPAFDRMLPALFGGLGVVFISRNWKIAIAPVALMLVLFIAIPGLGGYVSIMVPVGVLFSLLVSRIMYKKGMLDQN